MSGRAITALVLLAGCGSSGERVFEREVIPVLERSCLASSCHGVAPGWQERGEVIDWDTWMIRVDAAGRVVGPEEAREASLRTVNTVEDPVFSSLVRKALPEVHGGLPHFGGDNLYGPSDPDLRTLVQWIELERRGGEDPAPLTDEEQRFADEIQPMLLAMGCATANCHGPSGAVPYRLDPGVGGAMPLAATRHNLEATERFTVADSWPAQARLLRKILPLHEGGMVHKGGNRAFLVDREDPRAATLRSWICDLREARTGADCRAPVTSMVFVRGPVASGHPMALDGFASGRDLWLAELGPDGEVLSERNLTADLQPADVGEPAVDDTGERLAFSLQTEADGDRALWELHLPTGELRRLTPEEQRTDGGPVHWRDPAWGPDGRVWAVSDRDGLLADGGARLDGELYAVDPASGELERQSWTPHAERRPVFLRSGAEAGGELAFTALRAALAGQERAHPFRFPPGLETEYHQHFGITPPETLFDDLTELADGRYAVVVGSLEGRWGAGQLGVVDRNFGPELVTQPSGLPAYAPPLARTDAGAGSSGRVERAWRDPVGLPDGSLLASVAGDVELEGDLSPDFGIVRVWLEESGDGTGPRVARIKPLVDQPGIAETEPRPVFVRGPVPDGPWSWDPAADRARFVHQGVATIDALLANLEPGGAKKLGDRAVAVRLIEPIRLTSDAWSPIPADETRHGLEGTRVGLGRHGPSRVLAELPLAGDGSFHVDLPARTAIRLQLLDEHGVATGHPHNRWFDLHPGQTITQGIQPEHYPALCAACHGALDGDPTQVFVEPDLMTTASLTLARYEGRDPRHPIAPTGIDAAEAIVVDFRSDVQPILDRRCAGCHGGGDPAAGLSLTGTATAHYNDAYESLLAPGERSIGGRDLVDEGGARSDRSFLTEVLLGRELDAPGRAPDAAHPGTLEADELRTLLRWVDLGATWSGGTP